MLSMRMAMSWLARNGKLRWMPVVGWCTIVSAPLVACKPAIPPPPSGRVSLEFVSMSGSEAEFRLANGTSRPIGIVDARSLVAGSDFSVVCNNMILNNIPSERGWGDRDMLSSGESMRVVFRAEFEKDALCLVQLKLKDGSRIDSSEFRL